VSGFEAALFIGGRTVRGAGWIERENPARTDEVVGRVAAADASLATRAVEAADAAAPDWGAMGGEERCALLSAAVDRALVAKEELSVLLTRELGKVVADTRGELDFARAFTAFCAAVAPEVNREIETDDARGRTAVLREPYGVVAAITPWNAPIILAVLKVAPALATGNTVVVKPSPLSPLAVTEFLTRLGRELPAGVLNVVNGGGEVGGVLVSHPSVQKVAFTGGIEIGRRIMRAAAETVKPLVLELGGNDPAIFLEDAELSPETVQRAVFGTFLTTGQVCMAAKRLYVHEEITDRFAELYEEVAASALVIGDPLDERVTVGPMASAEGVGRVERLVEEARAAGASVTVLGTVAEGADLGRGYFLRPTLVRNVPDSAAIVREEQFGPTVPLLTFRTEDEVVERANDGEMALASSVWSADEEKAFRLARRLQAGFTFVNTHNRSGLALHAPFGGRKQSGFGREFGREGLLEYVQTHAINLPAAARTGAEPVTGRAYPTS
jgi:acyl-CoA reductase-like NAD-dependent aldehyde dehydrogenase